MKNSLVEGLFIKTKLFIRTKTSCKTSLDPLPHTPYPPPAVASYMTTNLKEVLTLLRGGGGVSSRHSKKIEFD